jgi:regulatory protein YycI of two-component signal transduction system YycFG
MFLRVIEIAGKGYNLLKIIGVLILILLSAFLVIRFFWKSSIKKASFRTEERLTKEFNLETLKNLESFKVSVKGLKTSTGLDSATISNLRVNLKAYKAQNAKLIYSVEKLNRTRQAERLEGQQRFEALKLKWMQLQSKLDLKRDSLINEIKFFEGQNME